MPCHMPEKKPGRPAQMVCAVLTELDHRPERLALMDVQAAAA